jgi:hypothetical protein
MLWEENAATRCTHINLKSEVMPQNAHFPQCLTYRLIWMCRVSYVRFPHNLASLHWLFAFRSSCVMTPNFPDARAGVVSTFFFGRPRPRLSAGSVAKPFPVFADFCRDFCSAECSHASCHRQDTNDDVDRNVASSPIASRGNCESLRWALFMMDPTCLQRIPCTCDMQL